MRAAPRIRRRIRRAAASALPALLVAACGSAPLSATQLRQRAGELCSRADAQLGRITSPASAQAGDAFLKQGVSALDPELANLKALQPPHDEAEVYGSGIQALSGELAALHAAVSALDQGADPVKTFRTLDARLSPLETDADNAWRALGITDCQSR